MCATELTSKNVRCRKLHRCNWCGEQINVGDTAHYRSGIYENEFFLEYMHIECWDAMNRSDLGYENEFNPMDQMRGKTYEESHA